MSADIFFSRGGGGVLRFEKIARTLIASRSCAGKLQNVRGGGGGADRKKAITFFHAKALCCRSTIEIGHQDSTRRNKDVLMLRALC